MPRPLTHSPIKQQQKQQQLWMICFKMPWPLTLTHSPINRQQKQQQQPVLILLLLCFSSSKGSENRVVAGQKELLAVQCWGKFVGKLQQGDSTIQPRQPAPGSSIEYARKILQEKRKRREDELALLSAATGTPSNIPKHEHDALREYGDFISTHTVGSELQAKLFQAVGTARSQNICTDDAVVDNALNGSMQTMSFRALQSITKESNLGRRLVAIARAVLEAGFYLWALFFVLIMKMCNTDHAAGGDSRFKLLLCCVVLRYDETPTRVRVDESNDLNCLDSDLLQEPSSTSATHAKILQVEQGFGVLLVDSSTGTYSFVKGQVPTGLFALKSTDGKTTSKALLRVLKSINGLKDIGRKCKFRVRHSCTDQAKSNYSAERLVTAQFPDWLLHHTPCDVHALVPLHPHGNVWFGPWCFWYVELCVGTGCSWKRRFIAEQTVANHCSKACRLTHLTRLWLFWSRFCFVLKFW